MLAHKIGMYILTGEGRNSGIGLHPVLNNFLGQDASIPAVTERLEEWNGKINAKDMSIEFESEKDLTMFLLRWGS